MNGYKQIKLSNELQKELQEIARVLNISVSELIIFMIERSLDYYKNLSSFLK